MNINVNLGGGAPQPLPCRVPGSFTCEVALGECTCALQHYVERVAAHQHDDRCPARPIRVSASINSPDGSWERSEVVEVEEPGIDASESWEADDWQEFGSEEREAQALSAARDRWALVKALVGVVSWSRALHSHSASVRIGDLRDQRDAVFAALADMARAEEAHAAASERATRAMGSKAVLAQWPPRSIPILQEYVERLIEQVGVL